uniref:Uncharacterized protein n=1 Tax=Macrostomum lignano TaxID=282301 RepID=A0A1I8H8K2_9PLAT
MSFCSPVWPIACFLPFPLLSLPLSHLFVSFGAPIFCFVLLR